MNSLLSFVNQTAPAAQLACFASTLVSLAQPELRAVPRDADVARASPTSYFVTGFHTNSVEVGLIHYFEEMNGDGFGSILHQALLEVYSGFTGLQLPDSLYCSWGRCVKGCQVLSMLGDKLLGMPIHFVMTTTAADSKEDQRNYNEQSQKPEH